MSKTLSYRTILIAFGLFALLVTGLIMGPAVAEAKEGTEASPAPTVEEVLRLERLVFARRIDKRQPAERSDRFTADGEPVYAHAELVNRGEPQVVTMRWERAGRLRFTYALNVGTSARWRTWSRIRATPRSRGTWKVTLVDAEGKTLGGGELVVE